MTELRQRMMDAMLVRGLSVRTQECYVEAVARMARHYHKSPALLSPAQVEAYMLHLVKDRKLSYSSVNHAASASRFLFGKVLGRSTEAALRPPMAKVPQKQPELLSREQIAQLFACCTHPVHRMALQTIYATGLRVSEVCALRVSDIDSAPDRMCVRVVAGKGAADRYSILSPTLLELLRHYCRTYTPHRHTGQWLFANAQGTPAGPHHEDGRHPHPAPLLCHAPVGRRRRPVHHQPPAGPQPHQHHQPLPALDQPPVQTAQGY